MRHLPIPPLQNEALACHGLILFHEFVPANAGQQLQFHSCAARAPRHATPNPADLAAVPLDRPRNVIVALAVLRHPSLQYRHAADVRFWHGVRQVQSVGYAQDLPAKTRVCYARQPRVHLM